MGFIKVIFCVAASCFSCFFCCKRKATTDNSTQSERHPDHNTEQPYQVPHRVLDERVSSNEQKDERKKKLYTLTKEQILVIENNDNTPQKLLDVINTWISSKPHFRNKEQLYIMAYKMMLSFEEAVDELKIKQHNRKGLILSHIGGKEYCITLGAGSDELLAAIDEGKLSQFKLTPTYVGDKQEWDGKIKRKESNKIYVLIYTLPKQVLSTTVPYDITFKLNQNVHKLQNDALEFIEKHKLFNILINNPKYHSQELSLTKSVFNHYTDVELNLEQRQAVDCIVDGKHHSIPYLLYGPPGTGKTKTIVAAIRTIVSKTTKNILICCQSNAACDEIANRLCEILNKGQMLRMYSPSYDLDKISSTIKPYCNLIGGELKYPQLREIYKFRVVICTLSMSGCIIRAREHVQFKPDHFSYVIIDECASAHETMALIPIAGLCTSFGKVHAKIILCGDPKQLDAVTKSNWSTQLGFKTSWFEQLFKMPLYQRHGQTEEFNETYITQLVRNYRSHEAILEVPNQLFYEKQLKAMVSPDIIELDIKGVSLKKFPIIFRSIEGTCCRPDNETSSYNHEEVRMVMQFITKLLKNDISQSEIGVVSPYKLQCKKIRQKCDEKNYNDITIGTAEVFQGQERKVMIISTVRARSKYLGDFLSNAQRFNVMLTRAQNLLIVVGDHHVLSKDPNWSTFITFCIENRCLIQG